LTISQNEFIKDMRHMKYMEMRAEEENAMIDDTEEMVNHPAHYNQAGIETIDAIGAMLNTGFESYLQGNIVKYLWRYQYKNGVEDLKKAQWYLNKLIEVYDDKS
tara:strand:+ start:1238 stop:1549 length:312 start_codon:yes stop_codon:yes gene_type:complete